MSCHILKKHGLLQAPQLTLPALFTHSWYHGLWYQDTRLCLSLWSLVGCLYHAVAITAIHQCLQRKELAWVPHPRKARPPYHLEAEFPQHPEVGLPRHHEIMFPHCPWSHLVHQSKLEFPHHREVGFAHSLEVSHVYTAFATQRNKGTGSVTCMCTQEN